MHKIVIYHKSNVYVILNAGNYQKSIIKFTLHCCNLFNNVCLEIKLRKKEGNKERKKEERKKKERRKKEE